MRNPNGYGGISFLGKNRRKPFRVRITTGWDYDKTTGKKKQKYVTLGYYESRKEAMAALGAYNTNPYDIDASSITFSEIFELWQKDGFKNLSTSSVYSYKIGFKNIEQLHKRKISDITKKDLQAAINTLYDKSESTQAQAIKVIRAVYSYCLDNDIADKDYSNKLKTSKQEKESIHIPYTSDEIKLLWNNIDTSVGLTYSKKDIRPIYPTDTVLMMIYTGVRPTELLLMENESINITEKYMIGGIKTAAGKNRIIPLHNDIIPLFKKRMQEGGKYLIKYKTDTPPTIAQYAKYMFNPLLEKINLQHLPHDGRHTFATFADRCEVNDTAVARIMGHASKSITKQVYTHKNIDDLVRAVNKITFFEK